MSTFCTTMSLPLTQIIFHQTISENLKDFKENSVLHLNISSLNKNFEPFAELYINQALKTEALKTFISVV